MQIFQEVKIAIADDHKLFRQGLVKILSAANKRFKFLIEADDGMELIDCLHSVTMLPDIVLLDISMPVLNGYLTLIEIRKVWPELKVLVISMYDDDFAILQMILNGANGFIDKNSEPRQLVKAITRIIEGGKHFTGNTEQLLTMDYEVMKQIIPKITKKELQFLSYCGLDMRYDEIAHEMGVGNRTVDSYRDNLFMKLNTKSRVGLALFAIKIGLVPNSDVCK